MIYLNFDDYLDIPYKSEWEKDELKAVKSVEEMYEEFHSDNPRGFNSESEKNLALAEHFKDYVNFNEYVF